MDKQNSISINSHFGSGFYVSPRLKKQAHAIVVAMHDGKYQRSGATILIYLWLM